MLCSFLHYQHTFIIAKRCESGMWFTHGAQAGLGNSACKMLVSVLSKPKYSAFICEEIKIVVAQEISGGSVTRGINNNGKWILSSYSCSCLVAHHRHFIFPLLRCKWPVERLRYMLRNSTRSMENQRSHRIYFVQITLILAASSHEKDNKGRPIPSGKRCTDMSSSTWIFEMLWIAAGRLLPDVMLWRLPHTSGGIRWRQ